MRIIFLSISFSLENKNLYNDLVESLEGRNHFITVVRCAPDISKSNIQKVSKNVEILSVKTGNQFTSNKLRKGINQLLIGKNMIRDIKKFIDGQYDLVLYATPPITFNSVVRYCKKKYHVKSYLMLKDIFPQNAVDLNMISKRNPLYNWLRSKEKKLYQISDHIGCMSQGNVNYLLKHNDFISKDKVSIFYNSIKIQESETTSFTLESHETVFLFGGNLGKPQNIPHLLKIVSQLSKYEKAKFVIVGKGTESNLITQYIASEKPKNLKYYNHMNKSDYDSILEKADVGIISLDHRFTIPNIPSKLPTYMSLRKPIIAITDRNTDLKKIVQESESGWWCDSQNLELIKNTIISICEDRHEQFRRGENGYVYLKKYFDVKTNVRQLERFMEE